MFSRWNRAFPSLSRLGSMKKLDFNNDFYVISRLRYAKAAAAVAPTIADTMEKGIPNEPVLLAKQCTTTRQINLDKMFWSKPSSLALAPDSPLRIEEPKREGIKGFILTMLLFYSKQSKSIRGANVVYKRILSQVDKPIIYSAFNLEKTFKTTFSLLVLHTWLCLRRLKEEGKEGVELGQYLYEIYNHDVELRVSKAGVNLLLTKWMKDLEKIFYGNIVAYDAAILPEAAKDELQNVIWRNIFSDEGSSKPNDAASRAVQAMSRYVRREVSCLSLTDKEAMFSGNFMFTSLKSEVKPAGHR
uniref:ubiquinol-cytochrome-c reductase complex assembly factor 1-like isoform X1 n=1 Tax=Ziziphus jujuba TaxID=326968 RepID=A0A6P6FRH8_ZIZJJ